MTLLGVWCLPVIQIKNLTKYYEKYLAFNEIFLIVEEIKCLHLILKTIIKTVS